MNAGTVWMLMAHTMEMGRANRPEGWSTQMYVRYHLDRLGLGDDVEYVQWSPFRRIQLPPPDVDGGLVHGSGG